MAEMSGAKAGSLALRIVALALSVGAAVVMGSVVSYNSALVYFVVGSVVSAVCSALALYLFVVHGGGGSIAVALLDAAAQALLFSAFSAALAARGCFASGANAFRGRAGIAAAVGACAAAAVLVAALAGNAPSRARGGGAAGGSGCKHGCSSPGC
ncbi:CASP-like protein 1U1 [Triticum dicoccoides]|uniref:CASP-like protein 1U1 n=1 Tax=Triticum dicoccoides TaxID=85692 RepID=UPI00188F76D6|nr:CASP-like protein 1U1 [Triticum dicoccoides]